MKNLLLSIWLLSLSVLIFGQEFPPPKNFSFFEENDSIYLSWSPPSGASPVQYNIYYSTFQFGDIEFNMGTTTDTMAIFPRPIFASTMCWGVTALYQNPIGESDLTWECITLLGTIYCPYLIDFESPEINFYFLEAVREYGEDTWGLSDETFISSSHSASYFSNSIGYRASLWTLQAMFETGTSRNLSFWYKIPENQGLSDTLSVHCTGSDSILIEALYATNDWQFAQFSLDKAPIIFQVGFRANAAGGNGVFLDDIRFFSETVDVKQPLAKIPLVSIFPNPASSFFHLNLNLPESANVKFTVCSMEGKVIKTDVSQHMTPGQQRITMNVSDLEPGIYLLSVQVNDKVLNRKLLKY